MKRLKIAVGVWGSSIRFKDYEERWSGQSEYSALIHFLLDRPEVESVMMIGKHDKYYPDHKKFIPYTDDINKKIKYKADIALVFQSQGAACISTIPGYRWVPATSTKEVRRTKVLAMAANYAAPITDYLNRSKVKWVYMATDPRYIDMIKPADLTNHPTLVVGSSSGYINRWTHATEYLPYEQSNQLQYANFPTDVVRWPLEKLNLFNPLPFSLPRVRLTKFAVVLNKILSYDYRARQATEWLPEETTIYGNLEIPGFQSTFVPADSLDRIFSKVRYTLVMPLYNHGYGRQWLTFKPYEMIRLGVIPFLHPDYDVEQNLDIDPFVRVSSRKELEKKMDMLEKNPDLRDDLLKGMQKLITPPTEIIKYVQKICRR